jgi:hypothetical protein
MSKGSEAGRGDLRMRICGKVVMLGWRVLVPLCILCMRQADPGTRYCLICGGCVLLFDEE